MVRVKICGITNIEDAFLAMKLGAHAIGFVFAESPRKIELKNAQRIAESLPPFVSRVGVFVDEEIERVKEIARLCDLDVLQLHGEEEPSYCQAFRQKVIKAIRVKNHSSLEKISKYKVDAFLLDTYVENLSGGTGKRFDWEIACKAKKYGNIVLSGGLDSTNISEAVEMVQPYAVDVSSGVEIIPGKKDPKKMESFFRAIAIK